MKQRESLKTSSNTSFSNIKMFFQSSVLHYFVGLILLMSVVYVGISMVSFFFSGHKDQSRIEGLSLFNDNTAEDVEEIENWAGLRGAIISNSLMNEGFGISAFFLVFFLSLVALRLMKASSVRLIPSFIFCSLFTIWSSVALAFFFGKLFRGTPLYIGGKHGLIVSNWLIRNFGILGAFLFISLFFLFLLTIISEDTILFLIHLSKKKK